MLGRLAELAVCQKALAAAGEDDAAAVVISGAPGIGKTTLWRAVAGSPEPGVMVLRTTGVPGWQPSWANLADLLDPAAETVLSGLAGPQASALRTALGWAAADAPVGEAVLERAVVTVLRGLAEAGVMVAIDDEQWVDQDTRRLLEAAVVRLGDAPVRWLVSVRAHNSGQGLARVLEHELGPRAARVELAALDDAALSELVMSRFPGGWSPGVLRHVVALAAGSPYAALEVARETAARGGRDGAGAQLPSTLSGSLRSRLTGLGPRTLAVVQVAALAGTPTRVLLGTVAGSPAGVFLPRNVVVGR